MKPRSKKEQVTGILERKNGVVKIWGWKTKLVSVL